MLSTTYFCSTCSAFNKNNKPRDCVFVRTYHASRLFLDNLLEGRKLIQARYRVGHLKAKQSRSTLMFALSSEEKEIQINDRRK